MPSAVGTECLGCEYECWFRGKSAIKIDAPTPGLDDYQAQARAARLGGNERMAILLKKGMRVIVQGITGREGSARAVYMKKTGTDIVGGVTPGRGGENVEGIPVFNTVAEAVSKLGKIDMSVPFVPGTVLKDAVLEALDSDIKFIVTPVERVPLYDILEMMAWLKRKDAMLLGPGSIGAYTPGVGAVGWLGGSPEFAKRAFVPGPVGVISRSGGQSGTVPYALKVRPAWASPPWCTSAPSRCWACP